MDSLSQFALGAAVGVAVMGRRTAVWKAALWGGVIGTLPDLDALVDHGDPVSNMTLHRAQTHALFWQTLAAVPIAALIAALSPIRAATGRYGSIFGAQTGSVFAGHGESRSAGWRASFAPWLAMAWLGLVTHALLDAMTVYGTRLALPFSDHPFGVGSIFIIDPLYTLPLLVGLGVAVTGGSRPRLSWNLAGLILSTAYLGWSVLAQHQVEGRVRAQLAQAPPVHPVEQVLVTPAPFSTALWRVLLMHPDGYSEGFRSIFDGDRPIRFDWFPSDRALYREVGEIDAVRRIASFSHGFFRVDERDGRVRITDLRMGQEPAYVFAFEVARRASPPQPILPLQVGGRPADLKASLDWLWRRMRGEDLVPPR